MKSFIEQAREFRRDVSKVDDERDQGLTTPENILRYDDIDYGVDENHLLDVYRPKDKLGKLPVIVSVHGGGWKYGDKERYQYYCMDLALRGFAVINFTYRLSPENRFPKHLFDVVKAFDFILLNHEKYGFDLDNVFAVGDSAGAHLLSLYCCLAINKEYKKEIKIKNKNLILPKAIGLNCGIYHFEGVLLEKMKGVLKKGRFEKDEYLIEALDWMNERFPPTYIISSDQDFLLHQQPLLKKRLDELKIENEMKIYKSDEKETLYHVFHLNIKSEVSKKANDKEIEFFIKKESKY